MFKILYSDDYFVAIEKPPGFHVHPPEGGAHRIPSNLNSIKVLRQQLDRYVYPVHRLDRATSGVLIFALDSDTASHLARQFRDRIVKKRYIAVARGWLTEQVELSHPLKSPTGPQEALTLFEPLARLELTHPVGKYPTARYTLISAQPLTGRMHQIRRHAAHLSHPLIGDTVYGDTSHNHFFKNEMGISGLLLKSYELGLIHPKTQESLTIQAHWNGRWHPVFELFGFCPWSAATPLIK